MSSMFSADYIVPPVEHRLANINHCPSGPRCRRPGTHDRTRFVAHCVCEWSTWLPGVPHTRAEANERMSEHLRGGRSRGIPTWEKRG